MRSGDPSGTAGISVIRSRALHCGTRELMDPSIPPRLRGKRWRWPRGLLVETLPVGIKSPRVTAFLSGRRSAAFGFPFLLSTTRRVLHGTRSSRRGEGRAFPLQARRGGRRGYQARRGGRRGTGKDVVSAGDRQRLGLYGGLRRPLGPASGSLACVLRASRVRFSVPLCLGLRLGRGSHCRAGGQGLWGSECRADPPGAEPSAKAEAPPRWLLRWLPERNRSSSSCIRCDSAGALSRRGLVAAGLGSRLLGGFGFCVDARRRPSRWHITSACE